MVTGQDATLMSAASPTTAASRPIGALSNPKPLPRRPAKPAETRATLSANSCDQPRRPLAVSRAASFKVKARCAGDGLGECRLGLRHAAQVHVKAAETEVRLDQPFTQRLLQAHAHAATGGQPAGIATRRCAEERQRPMYDLLLVHQTQLAIGEDHPTPPLAVGDKLRGTAGRVAAGVRGGPPLDRADRYAGAPCAGQRHVEAGRHAAQPHAEARRTTACADAGERVA